MYNAITILTETDSTNNYAMEQVHKGLAAHGNAFFAHRQTSAKGQRGKSWHTGNGENIALSIVVEPSFLHVFQQFRLSVAVALACREFYSTHAGENIFIKWPNDIYYHDRKAAGILVENVLNGTIWRYAVIGIGVNINQTSFSNELINPVSLKQITGNTYNVLDLANELYVIVMQWVDKLLNGFSFDEMLKEYNKHLYKKDFLVKLKKNNASFETTIQGVNEQGELLTKDVMDRQFTFGEVEWVL